MAEPKQDFMGGDGDTLEHARTCTYFDWERGCTCCLRERVAIRTERELHAAWRKRAEEAEAREVVLLARVRELEAENTSLVDQCALLDTVQREVGALRAEREGAAVVKLGKAAQRVLDLDAESETVGCDADEWKSAKGALAAAIRAAGGER